MKPVTHSAWSSDPGGRNENHLGKGDSSKDHHILSPSITQEGLFQCEMEILFHNNIWSAVHTRRGVSQCCDLQGKSPRGMVLVVFGDDATVQRDTQGTVCVWVPLHAGHCQETNFLLLRCISGSPKAQLSTEGQSCVLCVVPHISPGFI